MGLTEAFTSRACLATAFCDLMPLRALPSPRRERQEQNSFRRAPAAYRQPAALPLDPMDNSMSSVKTPTQFFALMPFRESPPESLASQAMPSLSRLAAAALTSLADCSFTPTVISM